MRRVLVGSVALLAATGCSVFAPPETKGHTSSGLRTDDLPESDNIDDRRDGYTPPFDPDSHEQGSLASQLGYNDIPDYDTHPEPGSLADQAGFNDIGSRPYTGPGDFRGEGDQGSSYGDGSATDGREGPSSDGYSPGGYGYGSAYDSGYGYGGLDDGETRDTFGGGGGFAGYGGGGYGGGGYGGGGYGGGGYGGGGYAFGGYGGGYGFGGYGDYDAFKKATKRDIAPASTRPTSLKRKLF